MPEVVCFFTSYACEYQMWFVYTVIAKLCYSVTDTTIHKFIRFVYTDWFPSQSILLQTIGCHSSCVSSESSAELGTVLPTNVAGPFWTQVVTGSYRISQRFEI